MEVRIRVDSEEIACVDDSSIGTVHPGCPGIDVADGGGGNRGSIDGSTNLGNVRDDIRGVCTCAGFIYDSDGRIAIEVFTSYGYAGDEGGEIGSVLRNGSFEGSDFVIELSLTSRCPESEKERGLGGDGSGDGFDGGVRSSTLDHGVQTRRMKSRGPNKILSSGKETFELRLSDSRPVGICGSIVESLINCSRSRREKREKKKGIIHVDLRKVGRWMD